LQTNTETRTAIAERRADDYERNARFEEASDLAERLGFPIRTTIYYDLHSESLYARTDRQHRAFTEQTYQAKLEAPYLFTGDQAFEVTRRSAEHDEALQAELLARGELTGNVLIKVSKVPDAVVEGRTSIKGYRRDTLRTFIRVYRRTDYGVECTLFSIDHNDQTGLERVGKLIDMQLTGRSSEDILADWRVLDVPGDGEAFVGKLIDRVTTVYDDAIYEQTGERRHAGSRYVDQVNAQQTVEAHPHLLREHFAAIAAIQGMALNRIAKDDLYEIEREKTAAAISLAARGHDVSSTSDTAVSAEVASGNYSGDCSSATQNGMQQGENELLKDWKKIVEHCPKCGASKIIAEKNGEIISGECGCHLNVCTGEYWREPPASLRQRVDNAQTATYERPTKLVRPTESEIISRLFGKQVILRTTTLICGGRIEVVDRRSGEVKTAASSKKELFALAA